MRTFFKNGSRHDGAKIRGYGERHPHALVENFNEKVAIQKGAAIDIFMGM